MERFLVFVARLIAWLLRVAWFMVQVSFDLDYDLLGRKRSKTKRYEFPAFIKKKPPVRDWRRFQR